MSDSSWHNAITDVPGIKVGHFTDRENRTGLTVILTESGAVAGADLGGGATGTRQFDAVSGFHLVTEIQAVLLTGGSAFGLDAAGGVMRFLEEKGQGLLLYQTCIPTVPTAVIFDLFLSLRRPDADMAYRACQAAKSGPVEEGSAGAGTGAVVGKISGAPFGMKGGIGTASFSPAPGLVIGALAVVNAYGDVVENDGKILAGARTTREGKEFVQMGQRLMHGEKGKDARGECTTLGVIATNARLDRMQAIKVAQMAQDGISRAISPAHTLYDGDLVICLSAGAESADLNTLGHTSSVLLADAIRRGIKAADGFGIIPAWRDLTG